MAITYEWYENPNAEGEKEERGLHPRLLLNGKVTTEQLCARIRDRSSLAVGDVKSAITTLAELCGEELCEGREVHIEGLGYFFPILQTTQQVTRSTPHKSTKVKLKSIGFRPDTRLKGYMQGLKVEQSKYVHHSSGLSETEMEMRLTEYFAEHGDDTHLFPKSVRTDTHHRQPPFETADGGGQTHQYRTSPPTHLPSRTRTLRRIAR